MSGNVEWVECDDDALFEQPWGPAAHKPGDRRATALAIGVVLVGAAVAIAAETALILAICQLSGPLASLVGGRPRSSQALLGVVAGAGLAAPAAHTAPRRLARPSRLKGAAVRWWLITAGIVLFLGVAPVAADEVPAPPGYRTIVAPFAWASLTTFAILAMLLLGAARRRARR